MIQTTLPGGEAEVQLLQQKLGMIKSECVKASGKVHSERKRSIREASASWKQALQRQPQNKNVELKARKKEFNHLQKDIEKKSQSLWQLELQQEILDK